MDWDEEFALQVFLKNERPERNCKAQDRQKDGPEEPTDKREDSWTVADTAGEGEVRETSTPLPVHSVDAWPGPSTAAYSPGEQRQESGHNVQSKSKQVRCQQAIVTLVKV